MTLFAEWAQKWGIPKEALDDLQSHLVPSVTSTREASESRVQSELRLAAVKHGSLWRNNAGAWTDETGRVTRYGLGNDSAKFWKVWRSGDLAGITKVTIQPHHIGRTFGVFTMIEVKESGWNPSKLKQPSNTRERAQLACLTQVASLGGIAGFACDVSDYERYILNYVK